MGITRRDFLKNGGLGAASILGYLGISEVLPGFLHKTIAESILSSELSESEKQELINEFRRRMWQFNLKNGKQLVTNIATHVPDFDSIIEDLNDETLPKKTDIYNIWIKRLLSRVYGHAFLGIERTYIESDINSIFLRRDRVLNPEDDGTQSISLAEAIRTTNKDLVLDGGLGGAQHIVRFNEVSLTLSENRFLGLLQTIPNLLSGNYTNLPNGFEFIEVRILRLGQIQQAFSNQYIQTGIPNARVDFDGYTYTDHEIPEKANFVPEDTTTIMLFSQYRQLGKLVPVAYGRESTPFIFIGEADYQTEDKTYLDKNRLIMAIDFKLEGRGQQQIIFDAQTGNIIIKWFAPSGNNGNAPQRTPEAPSQGQNPGNQGTGSNVGSGDGSGNNGGGNPGGNPTQQRTQPTAQPTQDNIPDSPPLPTQAPTTDNIPDNPPLPTPVPTRDNIGDSGGL